MRVNAADGPSGPRRATGAPSPVLAELIDLLALEQLEENLFRGPSQDLGWGTVFGGQVLGQALSAATRTVAPNRAVHSLHAYFLRPGDVSRGVVYEVERLRDGSSFSARRVVAVQHGAPILHLTASFHEPEPGFDHHEPMPTVPGPEGLLSERALAAKLAPHLPEGFREKLLSDRPIEIRPIDPQNPLRPVPKPAQRALWLRAATALPDDPALHRYLLAYASDFHFLTTALQPHGVSWMTPGMQVASLDHAMWFHRPFRMDEWLLYVVDGPSTKGALGLVRGRVFREDGALVAETAQEGLVRDRRDQRAPRPPTNFEGGLS
jgi:acyl-CoA thioesterase-2